MSLLRPLLLRAELLALSDTETRAAPRPVSPGLPPPPVDSPGAVGTSYVRLWEACSWRSPWRTLLLLLQPASPDASTTVAGPLVESFSPRPPSDICPTCSVLIATPTAAPASPRRPGGVVCRHATGGAVITPPPLLRAARSPLLSFT